MASLTFGSIGDIIAICDILRNVVQALSESRGSAAEYQALIRELQALSQAVSSTHLLLEKYPQLNENDRLRALLKDCRGSLTRELEHVKPYTNALQSKSTASAMKAICRKIRWLAGKDERAIFRAAIASHVLALSIVLTISSVDAQHQLYSATVEQLQQGFRELKLTSEHVQEVETVLAMKHNYSDEQALDHHAEINRKLDALQMTVSDRQRQKDDCIVKGDSSILQNRVYLMLVIKLLTEVASMGLIGAYHFLQAIQLTMSYRALHFFPQSRCLLVEDAIFRRFVIDVDLMPYETFTKLIEDKFASTPGVSAIASKQYFFEDKRCHRLSLDGMWSSDILRGKTVFMRARINNTSLSGNFCPACGMLNEGIETDKEIGCICGCKYTTTTIVAIQPVPSTAQVFPDMYQARRAYNDGEVAKFFKRVERILQRTSPAPLRVRESSGSGDDSPSYDTHHALEELERLKGERTHEELVEKLKSDFELHEAKHQKKMKKQAIEEEKVAEDREQVEASEKEEEKEKIRRDYILRLLRKNSNERTPSEDRSILLDWSKRPRTADLILKGRGVE